MPISVKLSIAMFALLGVGGLVAVIAAPNNDVRTMGAIILTVYAGITLIAAAARICWWVEFKE